MNEHEQYVQERDAALLSLDREKIMAYCRRWGIRISSNEEVFWAGIHKARLQIVAFSPEAREYSRRWLHEHGFKETM